jgi:hypothetical protein
VRRSWVRSRQAYDRARWRWIRAGWSPHGSVGLTQRVGEVDSRDEPGIHAQLVRSCDLRPNQPACSLADTRAALVSARKGPPSLNVTNDERDAIERGEVEVHALQPSLTEWGPDAPYGAGTTIAEGDRPGIGENRPFELLEVVSTCPATGVLSGGRAAHEIRMRQGAAIDDHRPRQAVPTSPLHGRVLRLEVEDRARLAFNGEAAIHQAPIGFAKVVEAPFIEVPAEHLLRYDDHPARLALVAAMTARDREVGPRCPTRLASSDVRLSHYERSRGVGDQNGPVDRAHG